MRRIVWLIHLEALFCPSSSNSLGNFSLETFYLNVDQCCFPQRRLLWIRVPYFRPSFPVKFFGGGDDKLIVMEYYTFT